MENWWWNYCLGEISAKVILDKVPGKLRGKLVLGKVPDEMRGKLMLEQMPGEMRKKQVLEKVPGKLVLEKVPGKLRRKLRRKWQKKCHFWTQFSRFYVYWQNVAIYVLWCLLAKRRDLRTLPDTKFQLPDTFNYSAPLRMIIDQVDGHYDEVDGDAVDDGNDEEVDDDDDDLLVKLVVDSDGVDKV